METLFLETDLICFMIESKLIVGVLEKCYTFKWAKTYFFHLSALFGDTRENSSAGMKGKRAEGH